MLHSIVPHTWHPGSKDEDLSPTEVHGCGLRGANQTEAEVLKEMAPE